MNLENNEMELYKALTPELQHKVNRIFIDMPLTAKVELAKQISYDDIMRPVVGWEDRYAITNTQVVFSLHTLRPLSVVNGRVRLERNSNRRLVAVSDLFNKTFLPDKNS